MNFQNIPKVESAEKLIDLALSRATKKAEELRPARFRNKFLKSKKIELAKLNEVYVTLNQQATDLIKSFPSLDNLPEFYKELIRVTLDFVHLKKSLAAINWMRNKVTSFYRFYEFKIEKTGDIDKINDYRKEFYGRICSVVKQIKENLNYLENCRRTLKNFPDIKEGMRTVALFGFPNTGKTTLLFKLTGSRPEIASYPFTTKCINTAYFKKGKEMVQLLDTPGSLARFDKMNIFERQAMLALKYCTDEIVFVFDLTGQYPVEDQETLLEMAKKYRKEMIIYASKADILDKEVIEKFGKRYKIISDIEKLKEMI